METLPQHPIDDIVGEVYKKAQIIDGLAAKSKKGGYKGDIRDAALFIQVAVNNVINRTKPSGTEQYEMEKMREKIVRLEREMEEMRKERGQRRAQMPPPFPLLLFRLRTQWRWVKRNASPLEAPPKSLPIEEGRSTNKGGIAGSPQTSFKGWRYESARKGGRACERRFTRVVSGGSWIRFRLGRI